MDAPISPTAVWKTQDDYSRGRGQETVCLKRTNWGELCSYASKLNNGVPCTVLPHVSVGGSTMARILQFNDEAKTRWVARVWMPGHDRLQWLPESKFDGEINAMAVINDQLKDRSPVPKVFGYDFDPKNPVGSIFVLMEYVRGIIAMDLDGGYYAHGGNIPQQRKPNFFRSMARAHALLASVRVPKIGRLIRQEDGTITVGPMPPYGGPFDTAADFFKAWAATTCRDLDRFYRKDIMRNRDNTRDEVKSMMSFPYLKPFPIRHPDLYQSNVITDLSYKVLAVIDWENARVGPWELLDFPKFIRRSPIAFDGSRDDKEVRDIEQYIAMIAEAEKAENIDSKLSGILGDEKAQDLGYAIRDFWNGEGRASDYMAVLEPFQDPARSFDLGRELGEDAWSFGGLWSILKDTIAWQ